jgi:hypothetical protein
MKSKIKGSVTDSILDMDRDRHMLCPVCKQICAEPAAVEIHVDPWRMTCLGESVMFDYFVLRFNRRYPALDVWYQCDCDHHFVVRYPLGKGSIEVKRDNPPVDDER